MSSIPENCKYSKTHEWVRMESDGSMTIGITEHAQDLLGDMVFIELPEMGKTINAGDEIGVLESVKAAADLYTPLSGDIIEINEALIDSPSLLNSDPYGDGWLFKIKISNENEINELFSANQYVQYIDEGS